MSNFFGRFFQDFKNYIHGEEKLPEIPKVEEPQPSGTISLKIICPILGNTKITIYPVASGSSVKRVALLCFLENESFTTIEQMIDNFKLIRVANLKTFDDHHFLKYEKVKNWEEFLMVLKRDADKEEFQLEFLRTSTKKSSMLESKNLSRLSKKDVPVFHAQSLVIQNFNKDLRKVIITLAQMSAPVLAVGSYASKLIYFYRQKIRGQLNTHKTAIKVLENLGFESAKIDESLKINANNYIAALDWLIENAPVAVKSKEPENMKRSMGSRSSIVSSFYIGPQSLDEKLDGILEIVKFYSEKQEVPEKEKLDLLLEMGFEEDAIRDSLKITRNVEASAIEWMLGKRNASLTELREGLAEDSKIRSILLESPEIQASLGDPKIFSAYMMILEDYKNIKYYIEGSNTSQLIEHIVKSYHDNKQFLAIDQFNGSNLPISALSAPTDST